MDCCLGGPPPGCKGRVGWLSTVQEWPEDPSLPPSLTTTRTEMQCPMGFSMPNQKMREDVFTACIHSPQPRVFMRITWARTHSLGAGGMIPFHQVTRYTMSSNLSARETFHADFGFFGNVAFIRVIRALAGLWAAFLFLGWLISSLSAVSGSSISEGGPGETSFGHLQITFTGKMWLTRVTVLSFHGYCSGSRCCL